MTTTLFFHDPNDTRLVITSATGQRWRTTSNALEAHNDANWADYLISPARSGTSATLAFTVPAALPAGVYTATVHQGTAPAVGSSPIGSAVFAWDGSALVSSELSLGPLTPPSGPPPANPTPAQALAWLLTRSRNKARVTDGVVQVLDDADTVIAEFTIADDGTTLTQGRAESPS